ncbi:MAG: gliding motility-associated ABC transporter substrate-binding protein GldG [Lentimicrobiaceae bacterium]|nr:gliding motility-associated ABC transporter substrate-binding protein GldG [Lentimicrobiaceae bacterium]MBQ2907770.1 gliding motility-associated ABC transporter substrate-binding protein GldG [Bacteroidales bacterium]MBR3914778.1 gliding motility-associated ABC transporter substrate-binding protein GldG [Bacteroidales bacterium]
MKNERKNLKRNQLTSFVITLVIIVVVNIIASFVYTRFDLTSEKRYTLSDTSKEILKNLDDYVYFRIYLEGEFPAGFKKLRKETKEMLDEFRAYSKFIDYDFINPSESNDAAERNETYKILYQSGLNPTELSIQTKDGAQQIVIWPCALVSYKNKELPLDLLDTQVGKSSQDALNNSARNLEYKFISAIKDLSQRDKPNIAFIEGHGELTDKEVYDITQSLSKKYNVDRVAINEQITALNKRTERSDSSIVISSRYDAIIIAKPTKPFSEKDKFIIDQYIMRGGKVLWLIDPVFATMDSLQSSESTMGNSLDLRLDDMFFKYGVRLNKNLLLDYNSAAIALRTGQMGGQAQIEYFRWYYFPLLNSASNSNIVKNINPIKADFVSSIDPVVSDSDVQKIPLLKTSDYTKVSAAPVFISLSLLRQAPDTRMFAQKGQNVAYLLKGKFESLYANRMTSAIVESEEIGFMPSGKETSMIVVADGDIIKNQFHIPKGYPLPLGFDQYTQVTYGNKEFIENAISYLVDGEGLISIRSRELKIRLLDMNKVNDNTMLWQVVNVIVPSALVVVFGFIMAIIRKRKFTK